MGMMNRLFKSFTVAVFSVFLVSISLSVFAEGGDGDEGEKKKKSFLKSFGSFEKLLNFAPR